MKKSLIIIFFIFLFLFKTNSISLILKEKYFTDNKVVRLYDITESSELNNLCKNIKIAELINKKTIIKADNILNILFKNEIYNISIIGDEIIAYYNNADNEFLNSYNYDKNTNTTNNNKYLHPESILRKRLLSFLPNDNIDILLDVKTISPLINLNKINTEYSWKFKKNNYSLDEIANLKNATLIYNNNEYIAEFDIKLLADVYISDKLYQKGEYINIKDFTRKIVDITKNNDKNLIVYYVSSINELQVNKDIKIGNILKWSYLKKVPLIKKGEQVKLKLNNNNFEIFLTCIAKKDGYENEKIAVKLLNGKEIFGIIRKDKNGDNYVEIL